jgi:hypothetical protein
MHRIQVTHIFFYIDIIVVYVAMERYRTMVYLSYDKDTGLK